MAAPSSPGMAEGDLRLVALALIAEAPRHGYEVIKLIERLKAILESPRKILGIIKKEILDLKEKYGDERRTRILDAGARDVPTHIEDLVPNGQTVVALTLGGYLKRLDDTGGRNAGRDPIVAYVDAGLRDTLLLFSAKGQAYGVPVLTA